MWGLDKQTVQQRCDGILGLRHREEGPQRWEEGEEEEERPVRPDAAPRSRGDGPLPPGPVAERGVAAGDADRVQPAGAELLVAGGGDEASPRGGAGFPIMYSCKKKTKNEQTQFYWKTVSGQSSSFKMSAMLQSIMSDFPLL